MLLLDTSVVSCAVNSTASKHSAVQRFLASNTLYRDQIFISAITISEAKFGVDVYKLRQPPPAAIKIEEVEKRMNSIAQTWKVLPVDRHVANCHAELRAAYAHYKVPKLAAGGKGLKALPVELWHQTMPPSVLQISENDLWIAAVALNYNLTLVSADQDHQELKKAYPKLYLQVI